MLNEREKTELKNLKESVEIIGFPMLHELERIKELEAKEAEPAKVTFEEFSKQIENEYLNEKISFGEMIIAAYLFGKSEK